MSRVGGSEPVAFVTGATGFTGREVVRQLRERGIETIAHVRPGSHVGRWVDAARGWGAKVVEVPWEPLAMERAIAEARPSVVFGLIGTTRARAKAESIEARDIYDEVDYRLTALLVEATKNAASSRPRFVYLSSIGADASSRSPYLAARGRAEQAVIASGLPHVIARPSVITGEGRDDPRPAERVAGIALDGALAVLGRLGARRLHGRYRSITNVELARALIRAGLEPAMEGRILPGEELQELAGIAR